jgi:hypothetical protein
MGGRPSIYENLGSGIPAPQADPSDLKSLWDFVSSVQNSNSSRPNETGPRPAESVGFAHDVLAEHCSPGADVPAVMFRCSFFMLFMKQGLLAPWLDGDKPSEFLFQVFATYPVHVGKFDTETLLQHIREKDRP